MSIGGIPAQPSGSVSTQEGVGEPSNKDASQHDVDDFSKAMAKEDKGMVKEDKASTMDYKGFVKGEKGIKDGKAMVKEDKASTMDYKGFVKGENGIKDGKTMVEGDKAMVKEDKASTMDYKGFVKGKPMVEGDKAMVKGDKAMVEGDKTMVKGDETMVKGDKTMVKGDKTMVKGGAMVKGDSTMVKGDSTMVKGDGAMVKGDGAMVKGDGAMVKGDGTMVKGDGTMVKDKATNAKQAGIENKQHSMQAGNKAELSKKAESESVEDLFRSVYGHELGGQGRVAEVVVAKTAEVQGVNTQDAIDKIEKIVDRIQVLAAGDVKTVNIKLNNSILADTEIRFHRESGVIKIEFMTSSADSFNFLSKGEQALMASMNKKFDDNVSVSIQLQQSDNSDQSGDGRSRNQYTGEEPSEDDANE